MKERGGLAPPLFFQAAGFSTRDFQGGPLQETTEPLDWPLETTCLLGFLADLEGIVLGLGQN